MLWSLLKSVDKLDKTYTLKGASAPFFSTYLMVMDFLLILATRIQINFRGIVPDQCSEVHRQYEVRRDDVIKKTCLIDNDESVTKPSIK